MQTETGSIYDFTKEVKKQIMKGFLEDIGYPKKDQTAVLPYEI